MHPSGGWRWCGGITTEERLSSGLDANRYNHQSRLPNCSERTYTFKLGHLTTLPNHTDALRLDQNQMLYYVSKQNTTKQTLLKQPVPSPA